jgi:non-ribosomal peptide synthetase component F
LNTTPTSSTVGKVSRQQHAIQASCYHPSGSFLEFKKEEIEQSIPDRFEEQVRKYPRRIAVKTPDHELTYDELNKTANCVARAILAQRGEGQEPVVLLLDKDASLVVAILGVLKAASVHRLH